MLQVWSEYALESSSRDLHNALLCTVLQSQNFSQNRQLFFAIEKLNFRFFFNFFVEFYIFLRTFDEFFSGFRAKFQKIVTCVAFSIKFAKTNQKFAENSEFVKKITIIQNYSLHSLLETGVANCELPNRLKREVKRLLDLRWHMRLSFLSKRRFHYQVDVFCFR